MSGAELGLALTIVGTVDICFKRGEQLIRVCKSVRNAEAEIAERVLMIDSHWRRTTVQLNFLQRVWPKLDKELQDTEEQILHVLNSKLSIAISKIERLLVVKKSQIPRAKKSPHQENDVKKFKYALLKESLDSAIRELETWQKMFDPSWFLILVNPSSHIDTELTQTSESFVSPILRSTQSLRNALQGIVNPEETIFLPGDELKSACIRDIQFSTAKIAQRAGSSKILVLDPAPCIVNGNVQRLTTDVRSLARRLVHGDSLRFGLMQCLGVVREENLHEAAHITFTFVFKTVEGNSEPRSLRDLMLRGEADHSLSDRLEIAKDLAKSVSFVHTFGFVHKNIRPENILLSTDNRSTLGHSYLVGFEAFRDADGHTWRRGDGAWERNLYRHPRRQGSTPHDHYIMQHDIYSLGVCLLEVGLWETFVLYDSEHSELSPFLRALSESLPDSGTISRMDCFVHLAREVLPKRMGSKYAKVVETCLTCLDNNNTDFGNESEFQDADGVLVGVRYIEKVLLELSNISI